MITLNLIGRCLAGRLRKHCDMTGQIQMREIEPNLCWVWNSEIAYIYETFSFRITPVCFLFLFFLPENNKIVALLFDCVTIFVLDISTKTGNKIALKYFDSLNEAAPLYTSL